MKERLEERTRRRRTGMKDMLRREVECRRGFKEEESRDLCVKGALELGRNRGEDKRKAGEKRKGVNE